MKFMMADKRKFNYVMLTLLAITVATGLARMVGTL